MSLPSDFTMKVKYPKNVYGQYASAIKYQFQDALRRMNIHDYEIGHRRGLKGA